MTNTKILNRYEGRRALVTGGGSGIGQATVLRMLAEGGRVVAADISEDGLKDTVAKAGDNAERLTTLVVNIGDETSVREGVAAAVETLGGLDVLVNAAGILRSSHTHETSLDAFESVIRVNLTGTFLMIRESIPALLEGNDSAVVNFSSTSAMFAHPYMSAYAASKGGIQSMTHALAAEYAKQGIRFTAVQPGSISSGMTDGSGASKQSAGPGLPEDTDWSLFAKLAPALGQGFAGPETVAGVVAMLASEDGRFITGTEVRIDGGTHF
ncbi:MULTISPECIES: SDR family NAD(P)-dependent oxidoreductase [Streptomyces]|uniref:SDR family oxidoreductase n=1 Tax=Streptomyces xanthii TaxID=2768069 RepID=A0A7H1BD32_9ACTN|nr:SDR family oxidoreductase [Streptomyces xanthii]QNS06637.1 SDR family oxidoreductase [Streptomyces xanthii]